MSRPSKPGLLDTVQALAATGLRGVHTRVQLAAEELEYERDALLRRLTLLLLALFFGAVGLLLAVLWLVMVVAEPYRATTLACVAALFAVGAVISAWMMKRGVGDRFMGDTLDVLAEDLAALTSARKSFVAEPGDE